MGEEINIGKKMGALVENYFKEDKLELLNFILVSCISADNLNSVADCDQSIKILKDFKLGFENADILEDQRSEYLSIIETGISICERDRKELLNK